MDLEDLPQQQRIRASFEDGMVKRPYELPVVSAQPDQSQPPEWSATKVEAAASVQVEKAQEPRSPLSWSRAGPVFFGPRQRHLAENLLNGLFQMMPADLRRCLFPVPCGPMTRRLAHFLDVPLTASLPAAPSQLA